MFACGRAMSYPVFAAFLLLGISWSLGYPLSEPNGMTSGIENGQGQPSGILMSDEQQQFSQPQEASEGQSQQEDQQIPMLQQMPMMQQMQFQQPMEFSNQPMVPLQQDDQVPQQDEPTSEQRMSLPEKQLDVSEQQMQLAAQQMRLAEEQMQVLDGQLQVPQQQNESSEEQQRDSQDEQAKEQQEEETETQQTESPKPPKVKPASGCPELEAENACVQVPDETYTVDHLVLCEEDDCPGQDTFRMASPEELVQQQTSDRTEEEPRGEENEQQNP